MSNRAYLLCVDDQATTWSDDPGKEIIAEGINEIPIFWASLFISEDRQLDTYEGDTEPIKVPNWCTELVKAKQRLASHRRAIADLLDDRTARCWSHWCDYIAVERGKHVKTNAAEVRALDPNGYDEYCRKLLQLFQEPNSDHLKAALAANELAFAENSVIWNDDEATLCKLAGAPHIREVPWLNYEALASEPANVASVDQANALEERKRAAQLVMDWINAERSSKSVDEVTPEELRLIELERKFWLGDLETYRAHLAENAFAVYPQPLGVKGRQQLIGMAEVINSMNAPVWAAVKIADIRIVTPTSNVVLLIYHAEAQQNGNDLIYRATASSMYLNLDGSWKLAFHQQSPDVEKPAES